MPTLHYRCSHVQSSDICDDLFPICIVVCAPPPQPPHKAHTPLLVTAGTSTNSSNVM